VCLGEAEDLGAVQAAGVAEVDVLDGRGEPQPGGLEAALDAAAGPVGQLAVDEQAEAFVEAESGVAGLLVLLGEGEVPVRQILALLAAGGYPHWISVEWEKRWHPEIEGPEVALPQYLSVLATWTEVMR